MKLCAIFEAPSELMKIGVWRLPAARRGLAWSRAAVAVTAFVTNPNANDMS
jgi:hypothetical protein